MVSIAGISLWSFLLLMQAYMVVPGSFGGKLFLSETRVEMLIMSDMGGALYGKYMRTSILISLTVSQIGFVCGKLSRCDGASIALMYSVHHIHRSESSSFRIGRDRLQNVHPNTVDDPSRSRHIPTSRNDQRSRQALWYCSCSRCLHSDWK